MKTKLILILSVCISALYLNSCGQADDETYDIDTTAEMSQQIGDTVASIDEIGGDVGGGIAQMINTNGYEKTFARISHDRPLYQKILNQNISELFISKSYAANCNTMTFTACSAGQRIREFSGCTTNATIKDGVSTTGNISGNVTLNFTVLAGPNNCAIPANGDSVQRLPNFTITGLRGASFAVTALTTGQTVTRAGVNTFTFSNTGINRRFTGRSGRVVFDSTTTATGMTITGTARNARTLSGGSMTVINNLTSVSCTLTPSTPLTWGAGCNCPTSGVLSGSCSDASPMSVTFSATCGEILFNTGANKLINMDRCQL